MLKRTIYGIMLAVLVLALLITVVGIQSADACPEGDVNKDKVVNMQDLALAAMAFGSTPGTKRWNADADVNLDNVVNILDLHIIAKNFGTTEA